jgi:hypothetical protein
MIKNKKNKKKVIGDYIFIIIENIKNYVWIQKLLKLIVIILFIGLFFFAKYKGKLIYLIVRL